MSRKTSTCTACLQEGHTKVSKDCPKYIPFWNKENEKELMELVDSYSEVIWEEVSEKMGASLTNCKNKYAEICPIELKVQNQGNKITQGMFDEFIESHKKTCELCGKTQFNYLNTWQGVKKCEDCYNAHYYERKQMWRQVNAYCTDNGLTKCNLCNKERTIKCVFHFDHLNMFNKKNEIGTMIRQGETIELIIEEIKKCQYICISCHTIVTSFEQKVGFTALKSALTRQQLSEEELEIKTKEYTIIYQSYMDKIYDFIRKTMLTNNE